MNEMSDEEFEYTFDPMHDLQDRWGLTMDEAEAFLEAVGYFNTEKYHEIAEWGSPTDPSYHA